MTDPYLDALHQHYAAIGGLGHPHLVILHGKPHAKMRHRTGNGNSYQPAEDARAEQATATALRRVYRGRYGSNVAVVATFVVPDAHTRDADNLMKHVLDSANEVIFHDDRQVTGQGARIELDRENPRTLILFGPHDSTLDRTVDLEAARKRKVAAARRKLQATRKAPIRRPSGRR